MRRRLAAITAIAALAALTAGPASASSFCYDLQVNANGSSLVNEVGCQDLPA